MQSQNEAFHAIMILSMWPKQAFADAEVVKLPVHLAASRFNHGAVTFLAVLRKIRMHDWEVYRSHVQLEDT